jgi:uncharacterized protein YutE (UPF0331/DUF86 family)
MGHLQRSVTRLREKQGVDLQGFLRDRDLQDIVLLNLQTAIQSCVDMATHIIAEENWELPGSLAGLFDLLGEKKVIDEETRDIMRAMAGFRNLIVHEYAELDRGKVFNVFTRCLGDFDRFLADIATYARL